MTHFTFIETKLRSVSAIRMLKLMNETATTSTKTSPIVQSGWLLLFYFYLKKINSIDHVYIGLQVRGMTVRLRHGYCYASINSTE